jgi:serine/threonine protein kinase
LAEAGGSYRDVPGLAIPKSHLLTASVLFIFGKLSTGITCKVCTTQRMEEQERFESRRKLGQGGVGAVYEGYDHHLRRRVAVKRLLDSDDLDLDDQLP